MHRTDSHLPNLRYLLSTISLNLACLLSFGSIPPQIDMEAAAMKLRSRIQVARRLQDMTQVELARLVGVQRSAVSHWESPVGKNPTVSNLRRIANVTGVSFEWLATGRGRMTLSPEDALEGMPVAHAEFVDDDIEIRLIRAFRDVPAKSRLTILEMTEQIATLRTGKRRKPMALSG